MIYTTYFANLRHLPASIVPIAICSKVPSFYHGLHYKKLAPKYDFFMRWKETGDNEYYIRCFKQQVLQSLLPDQVASDLMKMSGGRDVALVCYEKPGDFCHRFLVADWLKAGGYTVEEFQK